MEFARRIWRLDDSRSAPNFSFGALLFIKTIKEKNTMKKFLALLLTAFIAICSLSLVACNNENNNGNDGPKNLSFYAPDGAPALAIAKFINDSEDFGMDADFSYNVVSASNIGGIMQQGKGDFIVMPVNAASKLYKANADSPYVLAGVVTHGNLYIVSNEQITLDNLKGKVIGVIGQGLVPDLTLKAVLKDKGLLEDVVEGDTATDGKITIRYFKEASEMLPLLKQGKLSVGLVPEPALTKLTTKLAPEKTWNILDVQELYDANAKAYPQAVLMVKKGVYEAYKTQIDGMGDYFSENLTWVKENTADAVNAINLKLPEGTTPSLDANSITPTVVDNCKIFWQSSADAKVQVKDYINKIIAVNAQSAKAVADDFFA